MEDNNKYLLDGYVSIPPKDQHQTPGIFTYLQFVVIDPKSHLPLLVVPNPSPVEGLNGLVPDPDMIVRAYLKHGSTTKAYEIMSDSNYRNPYNPRQKINLATEVVCQQGELIHIADAEDLHTRRQTFLRAKICGIKDVIDEFPPQVHAETFKRYQNILT